MKPVIIKADCSVIYDGRATSSLVRGTYLVIIKPDMSVAIHGYKAKPLNYQNSGSTIHFHNTGTIGFAKSAGLFSLKPKLIIESVNGREALYVGVFKVISSFDISGLSDESIVLRRTEKDLVKKIEADPEGYLKVRVSSVETEVDTPYGHVDLVAYGLDGVVHAVEVKRKIVSVSTCGQIARYAKYLRDEAKHTVMEYVAAPKISKNAMRYVESHQQTFVPVDFD